MPESIVLTLSDQEKAEIDRYTQARGITFAELFRDVLKDVKFQARFHGLRDSMIPLAESRGILSEDDVFGEVS